MNIPKLKPKLNCFINLVLELGIKIIIKMKNIKNTIIYNNKFTELVKKLNIIV